MIRKPKTLKERAVDWRANSRCFVGDRAASRIVERAYLAGYRAAKRDGRKKR